MRKNAYRKVRLGLGPDFTITGNFNLIMIQKKGVYEKKMADNHIKDIKVFHIHIITSSNSPMKKITPVAPFSSVLLLLDYPIQSPCSG
jgi:hypothetical protein